MNDRSLGAVMLFHDYPLVNGGLRQLLAGTQYASKLCSKNAYPLEKIPYSSIILCGKESIHQFTYQGEINPVIKENNVKLIMIIDGCSKVDLSMLINLGINGIMSSDVSIERLIEVIDIVHAGGDYISTKLSLEKQKAILDKKNENIYFKKLTERELEVLKCITDEMTNKEIAKALFISPRTVETHRRNLIQKLKVKSSVGLVKAFLKTG